MDSKNYSRNVDTGKSAQELHTLEWLATDYNFTSRMMDTDLNDNVFILGDTVVGDYLVIKEDGSGTYHVTATSANATDTTPSPWCRAQNEA